MPGADTDTPHRRNGNQAGAELSSASVETAFVHRVYERLAQVYDLAFGPVLHPGRVRAVERMEIGAGDRILEVGVGTAIHAGLYPACCRVLGIDLSPSMLARARRRLEREGLDHIEVEQMDAAHLELPDASFDIVYAPYVMSVVPDPVEVAREMARVCRPGGRLLFLNHFRSSNPVLARLESALSPLSVHLGFKLDLDRDAFLDRTGLEPASVEKVNLPPLWTLITCRREEGGDAAVQVPKEG